MAFIGIVAEKKDACDIEKNLRNFFEKKGQKHNLLLIHNSNLENMKNIKFETVLICTNLKQKQEILNQILEQVSYVVVNADIVSLAKLQQTKAVIITFGFQTKATITLSSIDDENMILCIQREFVNIYHSNIESQEISLPLNELLGNKYSKMASSVMKLLYESQKY